MGIIVTIMVGVNYSAPQHGRADRFDHFCSLHHRNVLERNEITELKNTQRVMTLLKLERIYTGLGNTLRF